MAGLAVVLTGELSVTHHGRELARLGHGAFVGELALLDHATTSSGPSDSRWPTAPRWTFDPCGPTTGC